MLFRIERLCVVQFFHFLKYRCAFLYFSRPISLYLFSVFAFAFFSFSHSLSLSSNFRLHTLRLLSHPLSCIININRVRVAAIILPSIETFLVCFAVVKRFAENKKKHTAILLPPFWKRARKIVFFFLQSSLHC